VLRTLRIVKAILDRANAKAKKIHDRLSALVGEDTLKRLIAIVVLAFAKTSGVRAKRDYAL
jgi:hypothetical protein